MRAKSDSRTRGAWSAEVVTTTRVEEVERHEHEYIFHKLDMMGHKYFF